MKRFVATVIAVAAFFGLIDPSYASYSRVEVVLARDVEQSEPVGAGAHLAFTGTDTRVCAHVSLYEANSSTIRYEVLRPDGSLYDRFEQKTPSPPPRQYFNKLRAWNCWAIADRPIALTLGTWTVKVFVDGRLVGELSFQILAAGISGSDKLQARLQSLQARVAANPNDAQARIDLAAVYIDLDQLDEAAAQLHKASELNSQLAQPHAVLGWVYFLQSRIEDAERSLLTALRLQPDYAWAHYWIGRVYKEKGDTAKAIEHFRRVAQIEGDTSLRKAALEELGKLGASP